jgi:hypothetical protein
MSRQRKKQRQRQKAAGPEIHIEIAHAGGDLRNIGALVLPAMLYADRVTVYSPAAWMLRSIEGFASIKNRADRFRAVLEIISQVPEFATPELAALDAEGIATFERLCRMTPTQLRLLRQAVGRDADELIGSLRDLDRVWESELPQAVGNMWAEHGSPVLAAGIKAGIVDVADIAAVSANEFVAGSVRAALGQQTDGDSERTDELVGNFVGRLVAMMTATDAFPLLDAQAGGLLTALRDEGGFDPARKALERGAEAKGAAAFMEFLPYFTELPVDEVLDLRKRLREPLIRFRSAMVSVASGFETTILDRDFETEVEDAWRRDVAPALADIRERLAEEGLLKQVASVAAGNVKTLVAEAGGVFAAAKHDLISLSGFAAVAGAAALPVADVAVRAVQGLLKAHREIAKERFFFLHAIGEAAPR